MCESQDRWSIKSWENFLQVAGVVVDSGQETVFGFLPRLKTFEYCLLEAGVLIIFKDHQIEAGAGVVGDCGWIEPQFVILFSEWGSIQFCFLSKIDICL